METQSVTEAAPPPGGVVATADIDKPGDASTHFAFGHRLFSIKNCRFAKNGSDKMPCFYVPMREELDLKAMGELQAEQENKKLMAEAMTKLALLTDLNDPQLVQQRIKEIVRETTYIEPFGERRG